ncbi:MAG: type IV pilus assembly protein PilM [Candidatus Shapirobacteria bacterium]|nr:type IV pilus assembly protein PilM [Candidatus Shapirobacteria bacterium]
MSDVVGIDIGRNTIKLVSLSKNGEILLLDSLGEAKVPMIEIKTDEDKGKFLGESEKIIRDLMDDLKIKPKQVVASLQEDEVISRLVRLPPLKDSEIMDALKFEAETFVPYPLEEVSIDYEIVEKDDAGRLTIFVVAARNKLIQFYIKLFKSLGLELLALESPSVALRRVVRNGLITVERLIVVDFGEKFFDIFNMNKGNVYFARSISVGGESITRAISLGLSLDMASAEEYKKAYGMKETELEGKIRVAVMPVFNNIAEEIRKAMSLFVEDSGGKKVELLVLTGGGANLPGMAEELTKLLGIEVQVMQPFSKIDITKIKTQFNLTIDGCRFSLAVGLAMRGLT